MDLPGRLRSTTLGDLLGALHRAGATGTLELAEDRGRLHRVYLAQGLVAAVELEGTTPSLAEILRNDRAADDDVLRRSLLRAMASQRLHGEVLVDDFRLSPQVVGSALRRQVVARLGVLDRLGDARVSFRVAVRPPRGALTGRRAGTAADSADAASLKSEPPLHPSEFLHGRRRRRERTAETPPFARAAGAGAGADREQANDRQGSDRARGGAPLAWRILGLPPGADLAEIKRAYRRLARTVHPDLHPGVTDDERRALEARFSELTEAYRALVA
jgi:DnaJ domain